MVKPKGEVLITVQGNKMYVNGADYCVARPLLTKGVFEPRETKIFKENIKEGMTVLDIGANMGYYTLIASKLVGNKGKVYAFEPDTRNYDLLVKNIKINKCDNVVPIQKAVSNKSGKSRLFIDKFRMGTRSLAEANLLNKNGHIEIETTTLDEFFKDKIDFIKMDAEGAEGLMIKSGEKTFKNNSLMLLMEFKKDALRNMGTNPNCLLRTLTMLGFKIKHKIAREGFVSLFLEK